MSRLKDRVAVISGAATGLGRAAAERLAAEGAVIEILDIQDATSACQDIRAAGGTAYSALCDVTDEAQIRRAVQAIDERHGKVDILVNNAGILSIAEKESLWTAHQCCFAHIFFSQSGPDGLRRGQRRGDGNDARASQRDGRGRHYC